MASGDIVMKKKRVVWNEAAETDLIQLWKEKMPKLQSTRKNSHIYEEMSREMNTFGHNYTATEIKIKMHNFTNKYKQEKRKVGAFGGSSSVWKHFAAVHQAIGGYKSFCSDELVEDSIMVDTDEIGSFPVEVKNEAESSLSSLGEPPSPTESPDPFASSNPFAPRSPAASSSDPSNLPSSRDAKYETNACLISSALGLTFPGMSGSFSGNCRVWFSICCAAIHLTLISSFSSFKKLCNTQHALMTAFVLAMWLSKPLPTRLNLAFK
uniref:Myb/SANT-like DNA-binding domain-containing protein 1 n=1 Tax=Bactrocera dorsalis TaxID=27457 RepID=A0A034VTX9_BACDO